MSRAVDAPDRTRPPEPEALRPLELPAFERFRLSGGVDVWVAVDRQLPEVSLRMLLEAGAVSEPAPAAGTAELTGRLLTEGADGRSAKEVAEWTDRLGVSFNVSVGYDAAMVSLHTLSDVLEGGLDVLRAVVREPALAEPEVERVRGELADELRRDRDEADAVADHVLIRELFGDHRYGTPSSGTPESVEGLDRGRVVDFHGARYSAAGSALVVCGDVDPDGLREALEARFGDWTEGPARQEVPSPAEDGGSGRRVVLVDRPGSAQAEVRLGRVGLAYGADDFFDAVVANAILGGLFNSRVNMNLREEKGWTYGARSSFSFRRAEGPFVAEAAVETEAAGRAVEEFRSELRGMWERPPDEEEVQLARNSLVLSLPRQFETVRQVTRKVATQVVHDLPEDYWERYRDRIEAVTPEDVVDVARRRMDPDRMVAVVVADADEVAADLEERFDRVDVRSTP